MPTSRGVACHFDPLGTFELPDLVAKEEFLPGLGLCFGVVGGDRSSTQELCAANATPEGHNGCCNISSYVFFSFSQSALACYPTLSNDNVLPMSQYLLIRFVVEC